jgi:hypothetical protein
MWPDKKSGKDVSDEWWQSGRTGRNAKERGQTEAE